MSGSCYLLCVYNYTGLGLIATPTQLLLWWEDDVNVLFYSLEARTSGIFYLPLRYHMTINLLYRRCNSTLQMATG